MHRWTWKQSWATGALLQQTLEQGTMGRRGGAAGQRKSHSRGCWKLGSGAGVAAPSHSLARRGVAVF